MEDEEDDEEFDPEKVANATCEEDEDEDDIDEEEIKAISEGVEIDNENSNSRSGLKRKLDESCDWMKTKLNGFSKFINLYFKNKIIVKWLIILSIYNTLNWFNVILIIIIIIIK